MHTAFAAPLRDDIATVKSRLRAFYLEPDYPEASQFLRSQQPDGSWTDVDYANKEVAAWSPAKHMDRLKQMAGAYVKESSPSYHAKEILEGVKKGLRFWYGAKPKSDNWWHNTIGQQLQFERIFVLLENDLPPELTKPGLDEFQDLSKPNKATGQNLVWFAGEYFIHGLLTENEGEITTALKIVQDTIVITGAEGIQADYAFHQHGPQLYNGGYGMGFLQDCSAYAGYVADTRFAFAREKVEILTAYCLDGCRWMMRGPMFDYGANGRGISRPPSRNAALSSAQRDVYCESLARVNAAKRSEFLALHAAIRSTNEPWTILGNKHFWSSDFMVQQTQSLYCSVKMNSSRTVGIEKINGENLLGYWLPFGCTFIAPKGKEYAGIFPVWDWAHLPGVTSPETVYELKNNFKQSNTFVGGVSDGTRGACAMKLDIESPGKSLHAHKAWFFFGDHFMALGAGISSALDVPVDTTLNQTLLNGSVIVDGKAVEEGSHDLKGVSWVLHDGVGYLFPDRSDAVIGNRTQTGTWQSISESTSPEPVNEKVFSLWIRHGVKPTDGGYAYLVLGGTDEKKLADLAAKMPIRVLVNITEVQAVRDADTGVTQAIFYRPGQIDIRPGQTLQADQPCMVELVEEKGGGKVVLSSPADGGQVRVTLGSQSVVFELPTGQMAGSSQTKKWPGPL